MALKTIGRIKLIKFYLRYAGILTLIFLITAGTPANINPASVQTPAITRRVNVPYLGVSPEYVTSFTPAIFWFGSVDTSNNYADVRTYYYDDYLKFVVHIIDRSLWYDTSPTAAELPDWDSVSLYINLDQNSMSVPGPNAHRFEIELSNDFKAQYAGNNSGWTTTSLPITSYTEWRGVYPNTVSDNEGWVAYFEIPFTSLGLSTTPAQGTIWNLGVVMHDRDDAAGTIKIEKHWPESMNPLTPSSWGQLRFGVPGYDPGSVTPNNAVQIRQGLNGAQVIDAAVGGHTTCGNDGVDKWASWGNTNYAGYSQMNVQNQWDIADWPCFSKYYITFPLTALPQGKTIVSGTLIIYLFGGAGWGQYGQPPDTYIQVFTVGEDWNEATVTWNNAPFAQENISGTWVQPMSVPLVWPGVPYTWDVSRAVAKAYANKTPLRLVIYSADGERHTGKYFSTSDVGDWDAGGRPTLNVTLGDSSNPPPGVTYFFNFLPGIFKH
jgi:hypothetical protein